MQAIHVVREKLKTYPDVRFEATETDVIIHPQNKDGFRVSLHLQNNSFLIGFEGWHEEFSDEIEALNCFAFGLSDQCRLRVVSVAGLDYKYVLQHLSKDCWIDDSEVGYFWFPKWMTKERFLQNGIIKSDATQPK